jgi:hypothetical protein
MNNIIARLLATILILQFIGPNAARAANQDSCHAAGFVARHQNRTSQTIAALNDLIATSCHCLTLLWRHDERNEVVSFLRVLQGNPHR